MKLSKPLKNIIAIFISAAAIFYIGIWFMRTFSTDVGTEHTGLATVEQKLDVTGYILRSEKVLTTPDNGVAYYIANEGEKVAKNSVVANIYESENLADTQSQILEIERKIDVLEDSAIDKNNIIIDISKIDQQISETLVSMKNNAVNRNFKISSQHGDQLLTILNKRQILSKETDGFEAKIAQLESEKTNLSHSLTGLKTTVTTNTGGYFSAAVDGYENIFTVLKLENISVDSFEEMRSAQPEENLKISSAGKIITDFWWYILCPIDKSLCTDLQEGQNYELVFPHSSEARIEFVLDKKITQTDRMTAVLVFKTLEEPDDFDFTRHQEVQIIKKSYTGLKIPKSSLRILDGREGVYTLKGSEVIFKRIERIFESEGYYLIDPVSPEERIADELESETDASEEDYDYLALYDAVITKGKDLYDGKVVK